MSGGPGSAKTVRSGGATVAYSVTPGGTASGKSTPLVLVHGWGCTRHDWEGAIAALDGKYATVAIDLPGFGDSSTDASEVSIGSYADNVASVLDAEGITGAPVAGHSMGGAVVLELAARRPDLVSHVIGVDTYHYLQLYPTQSEESVEAFVSAFTSDLDGGIAGLIEISSIPSTSDAIRSQVSDSIHAAQFPLVLTALEDTMRWDLDGRLERVDVPVTAIVAEPLISAEARALYSDRIDFIDFPDVSHYLLLENPAGAAQRLAAAVDSV